MRRSDPRAIVIKYEWRDHLSQSEAAELADLLGRAADYDAEPEYSVIDFAAVERSMASGDGARHLIIWMLPYATEMGQPDHPECIAGLLRMTFTSSVAAEANLVIDPRLRSLGIVTLLLENVGLDTTGTEGWVGSGARHVTAWARGNHPASGRLSNRFLIPRTRRVWKLIRSATCSETATAAPVLEPLDSSAVEHLGWAAGLPGLAPPYGLRESGRVSGLAELDFRPVDSVEFGSCATITRAIAAPAADAQALRRLLDGATAAAQEAGHTGVIIHVDSADTKLVNASRLAGFQHDRTDVRYELRESS